MKDVVELEESLFALESFGLSVCLSQCLSVQLSSILKIFT